MSIPITPPDIWIGPRFADKSSGVLLLGESWPGVTTSLSAYIPSWLSGVGDTTYTQITNGFLLSRRAKRMKSTAKTIWDELAFLNFVPGSVGATISVRPSAGTFVAAAALLKTTLAKLCPRGCIIVGYEQSDYSRPVIEAARVPYFVVPHPRSGVKGETYAFAWDCLNRIKK
jgi:hypothetical protein